jgi:hypothetical protein
VAGKLVLKYEASTLQGTRRGGDAWPQREQFRVSQRPRLSRGPVEALGVGNTDGTYDTHSNAWHELRIINPHLIWDIP